MQSTVDQLNINICDETIFFVIVIYKIKEVKGNIIHIFKMNNFNALTHLEKKEKRTKII